MIDFLATSSPLARNRQAPNPRFELCDFTAIKLTRLIPIVADRDFHDELLAVAQNYRELVPKSGAVAWDDAVFVNTRGLIDGQDFPGGRTVNSKILIGDPKSDPVLSQSLLGSQVGETVNVRLIVGGREADYTILVRAVHTRLPPAVNDWLAQHLGHGSLASWVWEMNERRRKYYKDLAYGRLKFDVMNELLKRHSIRIPKDQVEAEAKRLWDAQPKAGTPEAKGAKIKTKTECRAEAHRTLKLIMIFREIASAYDVRVSDREVSEQSKIDNADSFFPDHPAMREKIWSSLMEARIIDTVICQADVIDKIIPATDLDQKRI